MAGKFYGVGVGPGDPELVTVKAAKLLAEADVVVAPKTEKKDGSVALDIAKRYIKESTEILLQVFPMVKNFAADPSPWQKNAAEIENFLARGCKVVFITLGDPMLYSTYIYIYRLLKVAGADAVTVPGVNSFAAIAAAAERPLVLGDEILTIIPATAPTDKIKRALAATDRAVLMKVYHNFSAVADMLAEEGLDKQAIMVSRCGLNEERVITDIKSQKSEPVNYLSTILTAREGI